MSVLCHHLNYWYLTLFLLQTVCTNVDQGFWQYHGIWSLNDVLVTKYPTMKRWRIHKNRFSLYQKYHSVSKLYSFPLKTVFSVEKKSLLKISSNSPWGLGVKFCSHWTSGVAGVPLHWTLSWAPISSSNSTDFYRQTYRGLGRAMGPLISGKSRLAKYCNLA